MRRDSLGFVSWLFVGSIALCFSACSGDSDGGDGDGASDGEGGTMAGTSGAAGSSGAGGTAGTASGGVGATGGATVCVPGSTQTCVGPGQCAGAQRCTDTGSGWGTCDCGGSGGTGGSSCDSAVGTAFCDHTTGNCAGESLTFEQCSLAATQGRCLETSPFLNCIPELDAVQTCGLGGTVMCLNVGGIAAGGLVSGVDCRAQADALVACMNWGWRCQSSTTLCSCQRYGGAADGTTCTTPLPCCLTDYQGATCTCVPEAQCSLYMAPPWIRVASCPLP